MKIHSKFQLIPLVWPWQILIHRFDDIHLMFQYESFVQYFEKCNDKVSKMTVFSSVTM